MEYPLTVPGVMQRLRPIAQYVLRPAKLAGLDDKASYRLRLAVDELVTNTITYGYEVAGGTGDVVVRAGLDKRALTITIEDTAIPLTHGACPAGAHVDLPIEERPIGGPGGVPGYARRRRVPLRHEGNRDRNTLVVRRPKRSSPARRPAGRPSIGRQALGD